MTGRTRAGKLTGDKGGAATNARLCVVFLAAALIFAGLIVGTNSASAQSDFSLQSPGIGIDQSANRSLILLQEGWIQWMSLFFQDRPEEANRQLEELMASLDTLGMSRLPELALGAVLRGVEAAYQGNYVRAQVALTAAERLDPGRPETSFGNAVLAQEQGEGITAFLQRTQGVLRLFQNASYSGLWWKNLIQAALTALLLAGATFVVLLMFQFGGGLLRATNAALSRYLPAGMHHLVAAALLLWPIVLPGGLAWLLLYWSILIFSYSSPSQRAVVVLIWLFVGVSPVILHFQERAVQLQLAPPVKAMNALVEGRLYGGLFSDLGVLDSLLPGDYAVQEVFGDVHRRMGQWERARDRYAWVSEQEADNGNVLVNIGNYYFRKEDFGRAIINYQQAAVTGEETAEASFNLSQAYSDSYLFDDHSEALAAARAVDADQVASWISEGVAERVVSIDGGINRRDEIIDKLAERFSGGGVGQTNPYWPLAFPLIALGLAIAFGRLGPETQSSGRGREELSTAHRWLQVVVPGLSSAQDGDGLVGFLSLVTVASLLQLLALGRIGYDLPWGLDTGLTLPTAIGGFGLAVVVALRLLRAVRMGT